MCLNSTISLFAYIILFAGLANAGYIVKTIGWIIYLLQISSYTYTFLANPGLPDRSLSLQIAENKEINGKICEKCGIIIPKGQGVVHCDDCNVCIIGK